MKRILITLVLLLAPAQSVLAISSDDRHSVNYDTAFYDPSELCSDATSVGGGGNLSANIPPVWRDLIASAAPKHPDADPRLVAAVLWAEWRGWPEYKTSDWPDSDAGADGPWQFIDTSWNSMGRDGDGDGVKDRENPKDAVHAAFIHHRGSAGKPLANKGYDGDAEASFEAVVFERNGNNLLSFAANYNGRGAPDGTLLKNLPKGDQNSDYVRMVYWLIATDFAKGWLPESDKFVEAKTSKPGGGPLSSQGEVGICSSQNGSVSAEGYSFPVSPQRKSQNGGVIWMSQLPCSSDSCHHDGSAAFDISRKPGGDKVAGTPVYAISDGTIELLHIYNGVKGCYSFQLVSKDKFHYYYTHLQRPSVRNGQNVTSGSKVAEIGRRECTKPAFSDPHLHIDRGCIKNGVHQGGGYADCRDKGMNDIINKLYEDLPE
ncbi:MAG TPA: peptidoglycan DD-metalloendopeptidase family protein [Candidatus Dormibacteraeota bacterium]|nr:peptidoglycan DD-metalloendopeptidase family protein [Candidatus Dormibacteraeota bacterium]